MSAEPAVVVRNVSVSYQGRPALRGVTLSIERGGIVGIIGPNGAGKSTLLKAILGLLPLESGKIRVFGSTIDEARPRVAYVPQREAVDWDFPVTVSDVVLMGRYVHLRPMRRPAREDREIAREWMDHVGISQLAGRQIGELSGGQRQRVFLARALAQESDMVLLDEPFVGVDAATESAIVAIMKEMQEAGKTVLVVNHDLGKITEYVQRLVLLNQRLIAYGPVDEVFTPELLARTYGGRLTIMEKTEAFLRH